jgi:predicted transcriptional regulator
VRPQQALHQGQHERESFAAPRRRVGRDVKTVHGDVTALLNAGVLDRSASGGIEFPYQAVKVEFLLQAA